MSGRNLAIGNGVLTTDLDANGKSIVNLRGVQSIDGKGLSTNDYTTQEKADLADLKAKRFDVAVDGIRQQSVGGIVDVPTNYAVVEVEPDEQGVARVRPNCINTVKVTTTESDTPVFIDDYGMTEGQPNWNDETWTAELGTLRHKYPFFSSDSYHISGNAYTGFVFEGSAYFDSASPQPLIIKSVVITKIYIKEAFDGMCPFDANMTIEYDGFEFYLPSIKFDYGGYSIYTNPRDGLSYDMQLPHIMESPVTSQTPIGEYKDLEGLPFNFCNIYFSYMLFSRHPITSNVRTILLDKSSASGVADYLVVIDLPPQTRDVEIIGTSDTMFLSSNNEALLLDSGKNLLSFTQLDKNTFFVNRLLIAEVGQ